MLGPLSTRFLCKSSLSQKYWDVSGDSIARCSSVRVYSQVTPQLGQWKASEVIPRISLEDSEEYLEGINKQIFMQFVRKMLQWDLYERQSAR